MAKVTKSEVNEMLETGVDDCAGTIEELSEIIDNIFEAIDSGDEDAVSSMKEDWES